MPEVIAHPHLFFSYLDEEPAIVSQGLCHGCPKPLLCRGEGLIGHGAQCALGCCLIRFLLVVAHAVKQGEQGQITACLRQCGIIKFIHRSGGIITHAASESGVTSLHMGHEMPPFLGMEQIQRGMTGTIACQRPAQELHIGRVSTGERQRGVALLTDKRPHHKGFYLDSLFHP